MRSRSIGENLAFGRHFSVGAGEGVDCVCWREEIPNISSDLILISSFTLKITPHIPNRSGKLEVERGNGKGKGRTYSCCRTLVLLTYVLTAVSCTWRYQLSGLPPSPVDLYTPEKSAKRVFPNTVKMAGMESSFSERVSVAASAFCLRRDEEGGRVVMFGDV